MQWRPELGLVRLLIRRVVAASALTVGLGLLIPTGAGATKLAADASRPESQASLATDGAHLTPIAVAPTVGLAKRTFPFHRADLALLAIGSCVLTSLATFALRVLRCRPLSVVVAVSPARVPARRGSRRPPLATPNGPNGRMNHWS